MSNSSMCKKCGTEGTRWRIGGRVDLVCLSCGVWIESEFGVGKLTSKTIHPKREDDLSQATDIHTEPHGRIPLGIAEHDAKRGEMVSIIRKGHFIVDLGKDVHTTDAPSGSSIILQGLDINCPVPRDFLQIDFEIKPETAEQRAMRLGDECGRLKEENRALAAENSDLRRENDKLRRGRK